MALLEAVVHHPVDPRRTWDFPALQSRRLKLRKRKCPHSPRPVPGVGVLGPWASESVQVKQLCGSRESAGPGQGGRP